VNIILIRDKNYKTRLQKQQQLLLLLLF